MVHLSLRAAGRHWVAACGADVKDQTTTTDTTQVTCKECRQLIDSIGENSPEEASYRTSAEPDKEKLKEPIETPCPMQVDLTLAEEAVWVQIYSAAILGIGACSKATGPQRRGFARNAADYGLLCLRQRRLVK